jgi:hypothetical protein
MVTGAPDRPLRREKVSPPDGYPDFGLPLAGSGQLDARSGNPANEALTAERLPNLAFTDSILRKTLQSVFTDYLGFVQEKGAPPGEEPAGRSGKTRVLEREEKREEKPEKKEPEKEKPESKPEDPVKKYFDISKAKVKNEKTDKEFRKLEAGETLASGDWRVRFDNGREFLVHIPPSKKEEEGKPLPVMFVIPGVSNSLQKPDNYLAETNILKVADVLPEHNDEVQQKIMVVTMLTENYRLGEATNPGSTTKAWAWNAPGCLRDQKDVEAHTKAVGYDDRDYFQGVMGVVSQLKNPRKDRESWGFLAGSQGAAFLNVCVCPDQARDDSKKDAERFRGVRNIFLVAGTMQDTAGKPDFKVPPGRQLFVHIYHHGQDAALLDRNDPKRNEKLETAKNLARLVGLADIKAGDQDPDKQRLVYLRNLGTSKEYVLKAYVASKPDKDLKTDRDFDVELSAKDAEAELKKVFDAKGEAKRMVRFVYRLKGDPDGLKGSVVFVNQPDANHVITGDSAGSTSMFRVSKSKKSFEAREAAETLRRIVALIEAGKIKRDLKD